MFFNSENAAAEGLWKKTRGAKVQKTDFLTVLGNPAQTRGITSFPTAPTAACISQTKSGNLIVVDRKE
jgi:hypothetical protein